MRIIFFLRATVPITPTPSSTRSPSGGIGVAAARDDAQRRPRIVHQQDQRVPEAEHVVHRVEHDVVDLLEVEGGVEAGRDAAEDAHLLRHPAELFGELLDLPLVRQSFLTPRTR